MPLGLTGSLSHGSGHIMASLFPSISFTCFEFSLSSLVYIPPLLAASMGARIILKKNKQNNKNKTKPKKNKKNKKNVLFFWFWYFFWGWGFPKKPNNHKKKKKKKHKNKKPNISGVCLVGWGGRGVGLGWGGWV